MRFPKARIVYVSATGVTMLSNLRYMVRLGLWGHKTPFPKFKDFHESVVPSGMGALELVAGELKSSGALVARSVSFRDAEFTIVETGGYRFAVYSSRRWGRID